MVWLQIEFLLVPHLVVLPLEDTISLLGLHAMTFLHLCCSVYSILTRAVVPVEVEGRISLTSLILHFLIL